ncbi:MAG: hypothetical protein V2I56_05855 [Desulfobacteraceae bacterium]|jgi:hypothetical protein|nr:hypothetical protein [Desulfobacteraceae bacterium]
MKNTRHTGRQSLWVRFVFPAGLMLLIWLIQRTVHANFWKLGFPGLQEAVAWICGFGERIFVVLAPLFAYSLGYFRGARGWERLAAGFVPFLAGWLLEIYKASGVFSPGETAYYALSPAYLVVGFQVLAMSGIAEIICRVRDRKRGAQIKVWTPLPLSAILSGLGALYLMMLWDGGVHWFYLYQAGYLALFHF